MRASSSNRRLIVVAVFGIILFVLPANGELFTASYLMFGTALAALSTFGSIKDATYCRWTECCNERHVPLNIDALGRDLRESLYGQHIVLKHLLPVLRAHYNALDKASKPLVLSFHGTPGTGKNFVADRIAQHLYQSGAQSKYVHKFIGRLDFPRVDLVEQYATDLYERVRKAVAACPRSLFIFDEIDKMPAGVFDRISSLMDHHNSVNRVDFRQATYIFLSNAGGVQIAEQLLKHLQSGQMRHESRLSDYDAILTQTAFNAQTGLKDSDMIASHLIDHYVPFLPLERVHVEKCMLAEFVARGKYPPKKLLDEILQESVTYQKEVFSSTGCKRINKLIAMHAEML